LNRTEQSSSTNINITMAGNVGGGFDTKPLIAEIKKALKREARLAA
jgi:hypothetical protein